jgi:hypothetical protein
MVTRNRGRGLLASISAMLAAVFFFLLPIAEQIYFAYTRPKHPVPLEGRTYPLREHYTVVYLTEWEQLVLGPINLALAAVFGLLWLLFRPSNDSPAPRGRQCK